MTGSYLTDERRMIQEQAREFTMREVLPLANKLDPEKGEIPMALREKMAEMGYFGILIDEKYGGLGLGVFEYCLVTEELARGWMSVASIIARANNLPGIEKLTESQRADIMPRVARGEWLGAFAMSESNAGSDIGNISCRARRDGDSWVINGNKYWCTFADGADYIVVIARTSAPHEGKKHKGLSAFMIPKKRGELPPGVGGAPIPKIGYHGWKTWELAFDNFRVPASSLLGEEGEGFYIASQGLEKARAHTAARAIGLARGALEDSIIYAGQREQFGSAIGQFQAIRFKIAQMATEIEAARQLNYFVCTQIDQGGRCDLEASMSKLFATEMAERVTSEGLQIHGGAGYTTLFAAERYWRDARLTKIFEGTSEIQQRII
jgi:alkylation response protein AidB-like acyl-CoA dehydrogenase